MVRLHDAAGRGRHGGAAIGHHPFHPRALEDRHPGRLGRPRHPQAEVKGMEPEGVAVEDGIEIHRRGGELCPQPLAGDEFQPGAQLLPSEGDAPFQPLAIVPPGDAEMAFDMGAAGDGIAGDACPHQGQGAPRQVQQLAGVVQPHRGDQPTGAGIVFGADEAAIAPRRAPADPFRLQQHDVLHAALGQAQGRRQPRQPAADDADPGLDVALQGRAGGRLRARPGVVAVGVAAGIAAGRGHGQG